MFVLMELFESGLHTWK